MLTLVFDTETTGFINRSKPLGHESQPHLVQLAFAMLKDEVCEKAWSTIVRCPIEVPEGAYKVHGINRAKSWELGISLVEAIEYFDKFLRICDRFICHNAGYDFPIMQNAYYRSGWNQEVLNARPGYCTMKSLTPILKVPHKNNRRGYKWPTLEESYKSLVNPDGFANAHDAMADVNATVDVLKAINKAGYPLIQTHNHGVTTI